MTRADITQDVVHELLDYDQASGQLTWRWRDREWFASDIQFKVWNKRFADKPALACISQHGHEIGTLLRCGVERHRVIFLYVNGRWPSDHDSCRPRRKPSRVRHPVEVHA